MLGAKKGQRVVLTTRAAARSRPAAPTASAARSSATLRPGGGYRVRAGKRTTQAASRCCAPGANPPRLVLQAPEAQAGPQLREDARRRRARDDRAPARRQDARRRSVPDVHRVLRLPDRRAERPASTRWSSQLTAARRPTRSRPRPSTAVGSLIGPLLDFAVVSVQMRGSGCSGGAFDLFDLPDHLRRLRRGRDRGRAELGQGRQGRHGRHLVLRHHAAVRRRHAAAAPRGDLADVGDRRHLHRHRLPGRHLQLGLRADLGAGAHGRRQAGARRRPALGARCSVKQGDKHCIANQKLRLQTAGRARAPEAEPVPHAVAVRPPRARARG